MKHHAAILAFDPGSRGIAVAASLHSDAARLFRLRFKKGDHGYLYEPRALREAFDCFRREANPLVIIEKVKGRGGWSAQSNFSFGSTCGAIVQTAADRGLTILTLEPQRWQERIDAAGAKGGQKERSLAAYHRLFPHEPIPPGRDGVLDHNAIDALLIAHVGALVIGATPQPWRFPREDIACPKNISLGS